MACFHRIGKIDLSADIVNRAVCLANSVEKEGYFGVTVLEKHGQEKGISDFLAEFNFDIAHLNNSNLTGASLLMTKPQEMHSDEDLLEKYGVLIMIRVPGGSVLKQASGDSIPLSSGDVVRIRYYQLHELYMPNENDRLVFCSIDFRVGKLDLDDQWRALVNDASGSVPSHYALGLE